MHNSRLLHINSLAKTWLLLSCVALFALGLRAQNPGDIQGVFEADRTKPVGESYGVGETFDLAVRIYGANVASVIASPSGGYPRLQLDHKQTGIDLKADKKYAKYLEFEDNYLYFRYTVQPGDFAVDLNAIGFDFNGATINLDGGLGILGRSNARVMPTTGPYSLQEQSDISIRTIGFIGQADPLNMTAAVQVDASLAIPVTRTLADALQIPFIVTAVPASAVPDNFTCSPATFVIPANNTDGTLTLSGVAPTATPVTLRLHPSDYGTETAGDLLVTVNISSPSSQYYTVEVEKSTVDEGETVTCTVNLTQPAPAGGLNITLTNAPTAGTPVTYTGGNLVVFPAGATSVSKQITFNGGVSPVFIGGSSSLPHYSMMAGSLVNVRTVLPTFTIEGSASGLTEGQDYSFYVHLSKPATTQLTITLTSDNPSALTFNGPGVVVFPAGEVSRPYFVKALDGGTTVANGSTATISGTCSDPTYSMASPGFLTLINIPPTITSPVSTPENPWEPTPGSEGFLYPFSWSAIDVDADLGKLEGRVSFGDGTFSPWIQGTDGIVSHIYNTPGSYAVTITVRDTDGGTATVGGTLVIESATRLLINEHKINDDNANPYKGLSGLGWGTVDDNDPATTRTVVNPNYDWEIKYDPNQNGATLIATPERGAILGTNEVDMLDSFFHVWVGDGFVSPAAITPIAPRTSMVGLSGGDGGTPQQVGGVFSREFYDEDGCGDIDHDELPDEWEISFGLDCESPAGDNGRMGNPDGDFLPRGAGENLSYPAAGNNYTPDGRAFGNVYEVRGFDPGLNGDLSRLPLGSASGPEDEPRYGEYDADNNFTSTDTRKFYGTDPTNPDTDGDGRDDGWEYYFWMNAKVREITGSRYSPSQVVLGTTITSAEIVRAFDPLTPGAADLDTDGDGLSDLEEYVLGTNPIHWDTDGDGMNDGWEVANGLDPFSNDGGLNPDRDWMAYDELNDLRHWQVYDYYGFDPRVGWHDTYLDKDREIRRFTPTTAPFTNYEEYYLGRVAIESGFTGAVPAGGGRWMTNPNNPDSDGDDLPDGWELYVSCGPNSAPVMWPIGPDASLDAGYDFDGDGLTNLEEFHALETCDVVYSTGVVDHQAGTVTFTTHQINNVNARWWNKFWATDPHNEDTDGDSVSDGDERRFFQYDNGYAGYIRGSRPGGMLNPCSVDTDMDFIPDGWEMHFAGEETATGMINGMDGTYFDSKSGLDPITGEWRNFDYDGDGLENYQEYWLNAVAHLQYDAWTPGLGYGAYDPAAFFTGVPYEWDWAFWANYWQRGESPPDVPYRFMEPGLRPFGPYDGLVAYATTDPRNPDSDEDGMDDYYEMFHGLNPLLSLTVNIVGTRLIAEVVDPGAGFAVYDFRLQPWLAGTPNADPDQDGIPNWEEALIPNRPAPYNHHTDPSPLWFTDTSYANSFVNLYYNLGSVPMYWGEGPGVDLDIAALAENMVLQRPYYMFDFEVNEGYDTDNDNIMDKQEIIGTTVAGVTDPLDMESPLQRKALYLDGNAAARTRIGFAHGPSALRSWTLEVWVRPENPASGKRQVILERPVWVWDSDPMPKGGDVRRNFRLGLEWDGTPFVEYENSGSQGQTEKAHGKGWPLAANEWTHLSATMSGVDKKLRLFVDGELLASVDTTVIPATGIIDGTMTDESFTFVYSGAPLVIGAADANPFGSVNGGYIYINGDIYDGPSQPALSSYYKGWLDEIRIWDGARTQSELVGDFNSRKRYMRSDVIASREAAVAQYNAILAARGLELPTAGYTFDEYFDDAADAVIRSGGETSASRLPPMLLYHYSFDNLPDPSYEPRVPGSFSQLNGRPAVDYPGIPWWHQAADRSTVYRTFDANPYLFVQWIENTVATLPLGVLTADGRFEATRAVDSIYYQRYSTGHTVLSNGYENAFNNTANPYNMVYRHGDSEDNQIDIEDIPATFDPMLHGQFNHLLPLRGAVADMRVPLWDKAGTPGYDDNFDSDGDGIPDWWEIAHGLDPFDPADADQDPDGDGLSNLHEYWAGTDPHNRDSDGDGLSDYEGTSAGSSRMNGVRFTDNDFLEDEWEALFDDYYTSVLRYDEHLDPDNDGWDNWSEARFGIAAGRTYRPDRAYDSDTDGSILQRHHPEPNLTVVLDYLGMRDIFAASEEPCLVIHVHTDPYMNGMPDAVYTRQLSSPIAWPLELELTTDDLTYGYMRQGKNYLFAFIDLDGSTIASINAAFNWRTWTDGEPAALADGHSQGIDIGWHKNSVRFGLTDEALSYARFSWADAGDLNLVSNTISILDNFGTVVFERNIEQPRTWLHEGDIIAGLSKNLGLGWGAVATPSHQFTWRLNNDPDTDKNFVNNYAALPAPTPVEPKNQIKKTSLIEFQFRVAGDATEFEIEVRRNSASGTIVYSGRHKLPGRHRYPPNSPDLIKWTLPYQAGNTTSNGQLLGNGTYFWRVRCFSPVTTAGGAWSAANSFGLDTQASANPSENGDRTWLDVKVRYPGGAWGLIDGAPIRVQAFRSASFNGLPDAEVELVGAAGSDPDDPAYAGAVVLKGLAHGVDYYIRAYVDQNKNRKRDVWESHGYIYGNLPGQQYQPKPIRTLRNAAPLPLVVVLRDTDIDNDNLPDALEYVMHGASGGDWLAKAGPDILSDGTMGFSDFNANGLSDLEELDLGNDPLALAPPLEVELPGLDPFGVNQTLKLTGFDRAANRMSWRLLDPSVPQALSDDTPQQLNQSVRYEVEFATSLVNTTWLLLTNFTSGRGDIVIDLPRVEGPSGFYRVKMLTAE